jgi:hypothetical protein
MVLSSRIIDDFDIIGIGIAFAELETDPPRPIHCHGPLSLEGPIGVKGQALFNGAVEPIFEAFCKVETGLEQVLI